ncbi:MAG TPA: polysaccharide deacetylase family protein [Polyangia bacterium]|nr:polysaccharide deacetylase family protein [Polyangia bacterium]
MAPRVALSFDDGPGPSTAGLLDLLAGRRVRASFFVLGQNLERAREIGVRMVREGHVLGNHTFSHARSDAIDAPALLEEIARTDALLREVYRAAGAQPPAPFPVRLPYGIGAQDARLQALASLGRTHVHWTGDFEDWKDPPAAELVARMRAHIGSQHARGLDAVLDLHDSSRQYVARPTTVEGVRLLLEDRGLVFFTVPV